MKIALMLSPTNRQPDPRNHCVPLLDTIPDPSDPNTAYIVMPFLRYVDSPDFVLVDDVLECLDQVLEVSFRVH